MNPVQLLRESQNCQVSPTWFQTRPGSPAHKSQATDSLALVLLFAAAVSELMAGKQIGARRSLVE